VLTGDVEIAEGASVWFGVVMRGDSAAIRIGRRSNVQDGTIVHADDGAPVIVGEDVTIGHRAIIHGCVIEDGAQVSMGAIVLTGARVGPGAVVGAGALVPEGAVVEAGTVVMGVPAKPRRTLSETDQARVAGAAAHYVELGREYRAQGSGNDD
jgi:carbonic anhydrase/acetyltransferase-like protein (isoleucine patch superfamily)